MCVLSYYVYLRSEFRIVMSVKISASKRLYLQLFVEGLMSYLRYLRLFTYSGAQNNCVVFFFVLCTQCCQFLWMVNFTLPLLYSLTFISLKYIIKKDKQTKTSNNNNKKTNRKKSTTKKQNKTKQNKKQDQTKKK